jgi:LPPG:FO 2-phospho-L-lactate transferase
VPVRGPRSGPVRGPVALLAGGVGGAKLAYGLAARLGPQLTVVVNTADDLERHGLVIWPDHDTVLYTLAGLDDRERGWGIRDETWTTIDQLERLGEETWFRLGDRDLATHLVRTERLRRGERPTDVAAALRQALGVDSTILPMTDDEVRTEVLTDDGWLEFQEYFVHRHQQPDVADVRFRGIGAATATPEVESALRAAATVVIAPSNPVVSIGPILALPGILRAISAARGRGVPVVAVSPIVGGRALRGPADRMLVSLGGEASAVEVARRYAELVDVLVIDQADADLAPRVAEVGPAAHVTDTVMVGDDARVRLADEVLGAADRATDRLAPRQPTSGVG